MNHVLSTTSGAFGETIATLSGRAAAYVAHTRERIALHNQYRQTVRALSQLSQRELADLGLHANSIRAAAYEAVYH